MTAPHTPSQTLGPYFSMVVARDGDPWRQPVTDTAPGEHLVVRGRLFDGDGEPVEDGLVELWQADPDGHYPHPLDGGLPERDEDPDADPPAFVGFGRCPTSFDGGGWSFHTVRPGSVPAADGTPQAPHLNLVVQARGMLTPSWTRLYLDDEQEANAADPVLAAVPAERRHTLVATRDGTDEHGRPVFVLDLHMQGEHETVFLDW